MRIAAALAVVFALGCSMAAPPVVTPRISPEQLAARLAEADRLASRGCYLCLKEAAAAYSDLLAVSDDPLLARKALENNLMLALREIELRMPDSGARESAQQLQERVPASYAAYFAALDSLGTPVISGGITLQEIHQRREERMKLAAELEKEWPASPMKAYFYLAAALNAGMVEKLKPQLDAMLRAHARDLSLQYRRQTFRPMFSEEASRALIGQETGFGELHLLLGLRAVLDGRMEDAFRELTRGHELLPDSASIALLLGNVTMAYARYPDALALYEQVAARGPDAAAELGRAKALSYLRRHAEAIAALDALLNDLTNNPGEKYYWRAWNRLRLNLAQPAYEDATAALKAMRNDAAYRLAGIAAFRLNQLSESRGYFEAALQMNAADCDAEQYLGRLDFGERNWIAASARFTRAVGCYSAELARMAADLAKHEKDISGLSNGLIAGLRSEMQEGETQRATAAKIAAEASRNAELSK